MQLYNKRILLGITGGIAAYKAPDLIRQLTKLGAKVQPVVTENATRFTSSLSLNAVSGMETKVDLFTKEANHAMEHIDLARWADLILVAPASANFLARLANGMADDLLTTLCLATKAPVHLAPAMNTNMWNHKATQANIEKLRDYGYQIIEPDSGDLACGDIGVGRLPDIDVLIKEIQGVIEEEEKILQNTQCQHLVITAGATQEALDPVRFLSNHSSGKMGFALAEAAHELGLKVTLIAANSLLLAPQGVKVLRVGSAKDMLQTAQRVVKDADIFISAAAVADFQAKDIARNKIKKSPTENTINLELIKTPDVLATIAQDKNLRAKMIGFAAETENLIENATNKLERKNLDAIVANDVSDTSIGFNSDLNQVTLIWKKDGDTHQLDFNKASKKVIAKKLLEKILELFFQAN